MVRIPIVTLGIALLCLFGLLGTWVLPDNNSDEAIIGAGRYWQDHPYLKFSAEFQQKVIQGGGESLDTWRNNWSKKHKPPDPATIEEEQAQLELLMAKAVASLDHSLFDKLKLSPNKGLQVGWLTHMFLHAGWLHFLGNMLFLYLCGPLLEDVWGRRWYLLFYLVGGVIAAGAEVAVSHGRFHGLVGASGAIAACMGAFAVRFAARKVSIFYFIFVFRVITGVWHWPAWVCGLLWFGQQVLSVATGGDEGVAVMAHVGGFAFGAVVAFGMKAAGLERGTIATSDAEDLAQMKRSHLKEVEQAAEQLRTGDRAGARRSLMKALAGAPDDEDATWMLVRLDLEDGNNKARAVGRLERAMRTMLGKGEATDAVARLWDLWRFIDIADVSPQFALLLTRYVREFNADSPMLEELLARAGSVESKDGNEQLLLAAELAARMQSASRGKWIVALEARTTLDEVQQRRLASLVAMPDDRRALGVVSAPAKVLSAVLEAVDPEGLTLKSSNGATKKLGYAQVVGVAAAVVPSPQNPQRARLLVDLVIQWAPFTSVRLDSDQAQVQRHFPGKSGREVYGSFIRAVFDGSSGAAGVPSTDAILKGEFPKFETEEAYTTAISSSGL